MSKSTAAVGIQKPLNASPELQVIVGKKPLSRGKIMKAVWGYIEENQLGEGQSINLDDNMLAVFTKKFPDSKSIIKADEEKEVKKLLAKTKAPSARKKLEKKLKKYKPAEYPKVLAKIAKEKKMTMFEMNKLIGDHLSD